MQERSRPSTHLVSCVPVHRRSSPLYLIRRAMPNRRTQWKFIDSFNFYFITKPIRKCQRNAVFHFGCTIPSITSVIKTRRKRRSQASKSPANSSALIIISLRYEICKRRDLNLPFMGDLQNLTATPISLPPGFIFFPTEEQLFCYYLSNKTYYSSSLSSTANVFPFGFDLIKEIDLYNYSPFELPEIACFPFGNGGCRNHWHCFTTKVASEQGFRKGGDGFWKSKGPAQVVFGGKGNTVLGTLEAFVFYRENSSNDVRTDWIMFEYALLDRHKDYSYLQNSFVLCRVFLNSDAENKILEHAEESDAKLCDVKIDIPYKQRHEASTSGIGEVVVHNDNFMDTGIGIPKFSRKLNNESDGPIVTEPVYDDFFPSPVGTPQLAELVRPSDGITNGSFTLFEVSADELIIKSRILQGDFIELDDLIFPLSGVKSLE